MTAIDIDGLTKRFGDVAVDDLYLRAEEGEIFGFLGPNGAGKSTMIDILLDFIRPTAGTVTVLGHDAQRAGEAVRQKTGVLPGAYHVCDRLTGRQHLKFVLEMKTRTRAFARFTGSTLRTCSANYPHAREQNPMMTNKIRKSSVARRNRFLSEAS